MISLDHTSFLILATRTLDDLASQCETHLSSEDDVDLREDFLEITLKSTQVWLINRHAPSRELWLSSPLTGGFHFQFKREKNQWIATRSTQDELYNCLKTELRIPLIPTFFD